MLREARRSRVLHSSVSIGAIAYNREVKTQRVYRGVCDTLGVIALQEGASRKRSLYDARDSYTRSKVTREATM